MATATDKARVHLTAQDIEEARYSNSLAAMSIRYHRWPKTMLASRKTKAPVEAFQAEMKQMHRSALSRSRFMAQVAAARDEEHAQYLAGWARDFRDDDT